MGRQDRGYKALNLNMFLSALYTELRKVPSSGARNFLQLMLINSTFACPGVAWKNLEELPPTLEHTFCTI